MSDEEQKKDASRLPGESPQETIFLPPLRMLLCFFDKEAHRGENNKENTGIQENPVEKNVEKLIEKLSKDDE